MIPFLIFNEIIVIVCPLCIYLCGNDQFETESKVCLPFQIFDKYFVSKLIAPYGIHGDTSELDPNVWLADSKWVCVSHWLQKIDASNIRLLTLTLSSVLKFDFTLPQHHRLCQSSNTNDHWGTIRDNL